MCERSPEAYRGEFDPTAEYVGAPVVSEMYYYPVKSLGGVRLALGQVGPWELTIGPRGFELDRNRVVVNGEGNFLTQRDLPRMALIRPQITADALTLRAPGMDDFTLPLTQEGEEVRVTVWKDKGIRGISEGNAVLAWLSEFLETECHLVRMAGNAVRQVDLRYAQVGDQVGFADGFPFLFISEGSLADLNTRLAQPIPMNRFRPNIVVSSVAPYAEDSWKRIKIGDIEFEVVKPCKRCAIPTNDQDTGIMSEEPSATLATYRRHTHLGIQGTTGVFFGQNLIHRNLGVLRLGDRLEVLETK